MYTYWYIYIDTYLSVTVCLSVCLSLSVSRDVGGLHRGGLQPHWRPASRCHGDLASTII